MLLIFIPLAFASRKAALNCLVSMAKPGCIIYTIINFIFCIGYAL